MNARGPQSSGPADPAGLEALRRGVHRAIREHGDDFVFGSSRVPTDQGAGADFRSDDPALVKWYTDSATVDAEDEDPKRPPAPPAGAPETDPGAPER